MRQQPGQRDLGRGGPVAAGDLGDNAGGREPATLHRTPGEERDLFQRADRFLVRDLGVGAVKLVEIDLFDLQSLEAALTGRAQMLGTTVRLPLSWPGPQQPTLG